MTQRFPRMRDELEWIAVQQSGPDAITRFNEMLEKGESVSMAAMLATKAPPSSGVDERLVQRNAGSLEQQFAGCPEMLNLYRKNYRAKTGEDLPADAVVYRSLVKYPGDPDAIVTHKHSLDEVKKAMKARNVEVHGDWENHQVKGLTPPKPQEVLINDTAMERYKAEYRMESEEYCKIDERDLEAEIIHNHTKVVTADEVMSVPATLDEFDTAFHNGTL